MTMAIWRILAILLVVHFKLLLCSQTANWWKFERDPTLDNTQMSSFLISSDTLKDRVTCVITCLRHPDCVSFFMSTNAFQPNLVDCWFHGRIYTLWERDVFGVTVQGITYYRVASDCPVSRYSFLSRVAPMCISLQVLGGNDMARDAASVACASQVARLAILDSQDKVDFIASALATSSYYQIKAYYVNAVFNGSDFVWDNSQVVSTDLLPSNSSMTLTQACLYVKYQANGSLAAFPSACSDRMASICEHPL